MIDKSTNSLYHQMRDDILNGVFKEQEKLTEAKLASQYNVSRTPIREVIRQLEFEYLIKDNYINIPDKEQIRNLFEMRKLIEAHSIKKAILLFQKSDIDEMKELIKIAREDNFEKTMIANQQFHEKIVSATKNPYLTSTYDQLNTVIYLFRKMVVEKERPMLLDEHEEIVKAIEDRDEILAVQLLMEHLDKDLEFGLYYLG
ncbi:GntR family transcriptional regulator [Macrococcoides canis]|uniref:HTH-type transcriptional repressor CsiR n=1 Tax=Macrococcoides canis TaxID=1855823 RepID=A0A1W7A9C9_9STAP|nr:GntR family transcriptional regulator [Macrococcus canis]ARQ06201.1 HTH-type transcriptional repressor CsiR [Macrococcus canis]WBF52456.1 GntR family transcriptional regulator [Macrococcus canis]